MFKARIWVAVLTLVSSLAMPAQAARAKARLFGWELEFTNPKVSNAEYGKLSAQANEVNDEAREAWLKVVKKLCKQRGDCRIREIEDWVSWRKNNGEIVWSWEVASYRVVYADGFWFQLSYDPSVVEVQVKPSTVDEFRKQERRIQTDMFDTALEARLKPYRWAETHLHTGAQAAWGLDLKLIRNFLVDGVNHPEFTLLFADGLSNAPPLMLLPPEKYEAFARIVAQVDRDEIRDLPTFVKAIRNKVYDVTYDDDMADGEFNLAQKFQQWNLERLRKKYKDSEKTIENRAMPAPQSARDVTDLTVLADARIEWVLEHGRKPIALRPFQPSLTKAEQVARFREYVREAGLQLKTYRRFLRKSCERYLTER